MPQTGRQLEPASNLFEDDETPEDMRTTVIVKNIAREFDEQSIADELSRFGLEYAWVRVPRNVKRRINFGYAFIEFSLPEHAVRCFSLFHGRPVAGFSSGDACVVEYGARQGDHAGTLRGAPAAAQQPGRRRR